MTHEATADEARALDGGPDPHRDVARRRARGGDRSTTEARGRSRDAAPQRRAAGHGPRDRSARPHGTGDPGARRRRRRKRGTDNLRRHRRLRWPPPGGRSLEVGPIDTPPRAAGRCRRSPRDRPDRARSPQARPSTPTRAPLTVRTSRAAEGPVRRRVRGRRHTEDAESLRGTPCCARRPLDEPTGCSGSTRWSARRCARSTARRWASSSPSRPNPASDLLVLDSGTLDSDCVRREVTSTDGTVTVDVPEGLLECGSTSTRSSPTSSTATPTTSILGRAPSARARWTCACATCARTPTDARRTVDDTPFGGGAGMVLAPGPIFDAVERGRGDRRAVPAAARADAGRPPLRPVASPPSSPRLDGFSLLCGRYEGIDQRVLDHCCDGELSIGDVVLAGGELAALVVIEAVARLLRRRARQRRERRRGELRGRAARVPPVHEARRRSGAWRCPRSSARATTAASRGGDAPRRCDGHCEPGPTSSTRAAGSPPRTSRCSTSSPPSTEDRSGGISSVG